MFSAYADEQEENNYRTYFGLSLNQNIATADFMGFENTTPCCEAFGDNSGLGFGVFAGVNMGETGWIDGLNWDLRLGFNNINLSWDDEYFVSHRINGDSFDSLYSNNNYDISVNYLGLRGYLRYDIIDNLNIGGFVDLSYPIISGFEKSETVARGLPYTFENGTSSRINESGSIEGLGLLPIVGASIQYTAYESETLMIMPELEGGISLTDMAADKNISLSEIRLGVSISFLSPEEEPDPPKPVIDTVPEPEPEPLPDPIVPTISQTLNVAGNSYQPGDTITIYRDIERTQFRYTVLPRLFFRKDGSINDIRYEKLTPEAYSIKDQIVEYFKNENEKITLKSYFIPYSDFQPNDYINTVAEAIGTSNMVDIVIDTIANDFQYEELIEEYRRVEILISGQEKPIDIELSLDKSSISQNNLEYSLIIEPDSLESFYIPSIRYGESGIPTIVKKRFFSELPINEGVTKAEIFLSDNYSDTITSEVYYFRTEDRLKEFEYRVYDDKTKTNKRQYLLGYNKFDESNISFLSQRVKDIALEALRNGKNITVIASTDDLGDTEYNKALAKRRADRAVELFGNQYKDQISIRLPDEYLFDNDHPYGRQLNRAILIRIDE